MSLISQVQANVNGRPSDQRFAEKQLHIAKWSAYTWTPMWWTKVLPYWQQWVCSVTMIIIVKNNTLVRRSDTSKLVFLFSEGLCYNSTRHVGIVRHVSLLPDQHLQIPEGRCWHAFHGKRACTKKIVDRSKTGLNSLATTLAGRAKRAPWRRHRIAMNVSPSMPTFNQFIESL